MTDGHDWTKIVIALVAIYGAALSTYNAIVSYLEKRRQLKVGLSIGFMAGGGEVGLSMLFLQVANPGSRTVAIQAPGLLLPTGQKMVFPNPQSNATFPHQLLERNQCSVWTPIGSLARYLKTQGFKGRVSLRGFCNDQVGTTHKGKKFVFNIEEWSIHEM